MKCMYVVVDWRVLYDICHSNCVKDHLVDILRYIQYQYTTGQLEVYSISSHLHDALSFLWFSMVLYIFIHTYLYKRHFNPKAQFREYLFICLKKSIYLLIAKAWARQGLNNVVLLFSMQYNCLLLLPHSLFQQPLSQLDIIHLPSTYLPT